MDSQRVPVIQLADELQVRKQTIFKIIRRLGIRHQRRRDPERGNQLVATLAAEEAALVRGELARSATSSTESGPDSISAEADAGFFYLIELEPEHDPGRFKVGFTIDLDERLRKHRCSAPFARYRRTWTCRRTWERAAMDCTTGGCERLHTEVFRTMNLGTVIARADRFFELMPTVDPGATDDEPDTSTASDRG